MLPISVFPLPQKSKLNVFTLNKTIRATIKINIGINLPMNVIKLINAACLTPLNISALINHINMIAPIIAAVVFPLPNAGKK